MVFPDMMDPGAEKMTIPPSVISMGMRKKGERRERQVDEGERKGKGRERLTKELVVLHQRVLASERDSVRDGTDSI